MKSIAHQMQIQNKPQTAQHEQRNTRIIFHKFICLLFTSVVQRHICLPNTYVLSFLRRKLFECNNLNLCDCLKLTKLRTVEIGYGEKSNKQKQIWCSIEENTCCEWQQLSSVHKHREEKVLLFYSHDSFQSNATCRGCQESRETTITPTSLAFHIPLISPKAAYLF